MTQEHEEQLVAEQDVLAQEPAEQVTGVSLSRRWWGRRRNRRRSKWQQLKKWQLLKKCVQWKTWQRSRQQGVSVAVPPVTAPRVVDISGDDAAGICETWSGQVCAAGFD
jgi:hypothetical protein